MKGEEVASKLQEIDDNFVRALDAASGLLQHVRAFDKAMQGVADGASVWCHFFDHVRDVSSSASSSAATHAAAGEGDADDLGLEGEVAEGQRPRTAVKASRRTGRAWKNARTEGTSHNDSAASDLSSQNPPTPTLPVFSKSFAKTPMFRKMRASSSASSDDDAEQGRSPALAREDDENVGGDDSLMMDFKTPRPGRGPHGAAETSFADNVLDLSEISAATPSTPQDGDYGPTSAVKSRQLLEHGTPARHVTSMLISASMSAAREPDTVVNISNASSNPATPVPLSPFMTDALLHSDDEDHELGPGSHRQHQAAAAATVAGLDDEEEEEELVGTPERVHCESFEGEDQENLQTQPHAQSRHELGRKQSQNAAKSPQTAERRLAAVTGTPISRSVARRRRRSLMRYAAEAGEEAVFGGEGGAERGGADARGSMSADDSEEELLDAGLEDDAMNDGPPPAFDLKLFPHLFQSGEGAAQVTAVYSQFASHEAFCLSELRQRLPKFGQARLELMLDMLVSRGLLRPFTLENHLYWRAPSADEF